MARPAPCRPRRSRQTTAPADWACGRGIHARRSRPCRRPRSRAHATPATAARRVRRRRWSRSPPTMRQADRPCPTISGRGCFPACRTAAAWPRACLQPSWQTDIAWGYRTTWAHPNACDATCSAHTEMQFRAIASGTLGAPCSNSVCAGKQVFTKIRGKPSLNSKQKGRRSAPSFVW